MRISVVIPAHNEERYIAACIESINVAQNRLNKPIEIIVVLNRCDDRTGEIALSKGAKVLENNIRSISAVRNEGIRAAKGDIIATIDADNVMSPETLKEIDDLINSGKYIGGGAVIKLNRMSAGLFFTELFVRISCRLSGCYAGIIWAKRETFNAVGGFTECVTIGEDVDIARKIIAYGKKKKLTYGCLKKSRLIFSTRKFDRFGDWLAFKVFLKESKKLLFPRRPIEKELVDKYYYDFEH